MNTPILMTVSAAIAIAGTTPAEAKCGCAAWLLTEQVTEGKPYIVLSASCVGNKPSSKVEIVDAKGASVPVKLLTSHEGYNRSTQFVFTPDRALAPGSYKVTHDRDTSLLTVIAAATNAAPPAWSGNAKVIGQRQDEFGCGPAKTVEIQAGADATLAFVELEDDKKQRYSGYVPVKDGKLGLGHGMCSGPFELQKGKSYSAQITLLAPERGTSSTSKTVAFTYKP